MIKHLVFVTLFLCVYIPLKSQGEIDDQKRVMYRNESTIGVFLNTNGFGVNYRYGFWRDARNQFILDADLSYVKDNKEVKTSYSYTYTTNVKRYAYGKENFFWELKGLAGCRYRPDSLPKGDSHYGHNQEQVPVFQFNRRI
jgi:hypothetical protein